jgi:hypothetical protein
MTDQGEHPYSYAGADPVNGHDPTGNEDILDASFLFPIAILPARVMVAMGSGVSCLFSLGSSSLATAGPLLGKVAGCMMAGALQGPSKPGPKPAARVKTSALRS